MPSVIVLEINIALPESILIMDNNSAGSFREFGLHADINKKYSKITTEFWNCEFKVKEADVGKYKDRRYGSQQQQLGDREREARECSSSGSTQFNPQEPFSPPPYILLPPHTLMYGYTQTPPDSSLERCSSLNQRQCRHPPACLLHTIRYNSAVSEVMRC